MPKKIFKDAEYPLYEIVMSEEYNTGIRLISLVEDPAIDVKGMAFNKDIINNCEFKSIEDKQMIIGPVLIPNKKILQKDNNGEFYYVFYSEDTVIKMVSKFNKENTGKSINYDHTREMAPAFIMESWIVEDPFYDKSKMYGYNLPIGSWVIMAKVEDKDFWLKEVKEAGKFSFSFEGVMGEAKASYYFSLAKEEKESYSFNNIIDSLTDEELNDIYSSLKNGE